MGLSLLVCICYWGSQDLLLLVGLGLQRALAYLHPECLEWVIHCNGKPENILLDSEFKPKIADFGLAKLLQRGNTSSDFSRIQGTKGYMAPGWALDLTITAKVDVFSYGVMALEMVRGIRVSNWAIADAGDGMEEMEEAELTKFVRIRRMIQSDPSNGTWIEQVMDPRLRGRYSKR
ncbi:hypothetical protein CDL15_Pgr000619 [Punica granatum]|uniref:Protein kinase domain-containing protein n=1 Tax=Punica granatum TaxID=22663 RepID=A0A218W2V0_PUNGR|nr:hypothetical protein CDL15_Pgr000619 [Punica granatum]